MNIQKEIASVLLVTHEAHLETIEPNCGLSIERYGLEIRILHAKIAALKKIIGPVPEIMSEELKKITAEEWNDTYLVGLPIVLTEDDGSMTYTQTRSVAWVSNNLEPVIKVKGKTGGYLLSRIRAK